MACYSGCKQFFMALSGSEMVQIVNHRTVFYRSSQLSDLIGNRVGVLLLDRPIVVGCPYICIKAMQIYRSIIHISYLERVPLSLV